MSAYINCVVEGCTASGMRHWFNKHVEKEHVSCVCGWVGVVFSKHVAQATIKGHLGPHALVDNNVSANG